MKILLELRYIGARYHGWQVQSNAPSVQKTVQNALETLLCSPCALTGCSRTDAGVHALQYFCTAQSPALDRFPADRLPVALNRFLPDDIAAVSARPVPDSFHPRYDAAAKEYEYRIFCGETRDPFLSGRVWTRPGEELDVPKMNECAQALVGSHDFSSFCAAGGKPGNRVRTVYFCRVTRRAEEVVINICADGFLYNMVRIIAGTLFLIGMGAEIDIASVLEKRDRAAAGRTAPAEGLYLKRVYYSSAFQ